MNSTTVQIDHLLVKDNLASQLVNLYIDWDSKRQSWLNEKKELKEYIFATDTKKTSNSKLPWKNTTTIPKLTQIRDNLFANYMAALFPKRNWLDWQGASNASTGKKKATAIKAYMQSVMDQPEFKAEIAKMVLDYIDAGNVFATTQWVDNTVTAENGLTQSIGYVGPLPLRISPTNIVMNPIATSFSKTGKFIQSVHTFGDFARIVESETPPDDIETVKGILSYLRQIRHSVNGLAPTQYAIQDATLAVSGFSDFCSYLQSPYVEVLTFYGDYYDLENGVLKKDRIVTIVDRHKVISDVSNQSALSYNNIWSTGWRVRQDSLLAMGPLDNLVGMQYRIDHLENLKADIFDLVAAPPIKIKGLVDDFVWGPFARINVGEDGDVEVFAPDVNALNANIEIANLQNQMEEMAGSPKEAMGFRTPGEKTMYEVQRLENAAARIFATKIAQFEEQILEPLMNGLLELARRKVTKATLKVFDTELNTSSFLEITKEDLAGAGRIRPMAARHFAEKAELVQNINNFMQTIGNDELVKVHFSGLKMAQMFEDILDIKPFELVTPYIRVSEQEEAQRLQNVSAENTLSETTAPTGLTPGDTDSSILNADG